MQSFVVGSGAMAASAASRPYAAKAHEYVPEFSNKATDYKEFKKRVILYEKKMALANRKGETAFNVMAALTGRAWDAVEDMDMAELESDQGTKKLLDRLDSVFKFDAITELPADFETFFMHTHRRRNQTIQEYTADYERQLRRLESHNVTLPDKVIGWFYLRRAGLKQDQRQMVMSTLSVEKISLETVRKALNFVIGQDSTPIGDISPSGKWQKKNESIYYEDEWPQSQDWDEIDFEDEAAETYYQWDDADAAYYEDEQEVDAAFPAEEAAAEYDEIYAAYVEARQKVNQMRLSRGFYPVVAMIDGNQREPNYKGSPKGRKGKSKKGKGSSKQAPRPPQAKARGRSALGGVKCLRCGTTGHYARNCPQAVNKRKADTPAEDDVMMVENDNKLDNINIYEEDGTESEPDDTAIWDCGAASVLVSKSQLRRYIKMLMIAGYDVHRIQAWTCQKGFRFGNGNKDKTSWCVLLPTWFRGERRDILVYVIGGKVPFLLGRPLMEKMGVSINYADKQIKWNNEEWKPAPLGPKGEYILHLGEHLISAKNKPVHQVLIPDDFYDHVNMDSLVDIMKVLEEDDMVLVTEVQNLPNEDGSMKLLDVGGVPMTPEDAEDKRALAGPDICEGSPIQLLYTTAETPPRDEEPDSSPQDLELSGSAVIDAESPVVAQEPGQVSQEQPRQQDPGTGKKSKNPDAERENLKRLTPNKLRALTRSSVNYVKKIDNLLKDSKKITGERSKKMKIWEVFAGRGRLTQILKEKYPSVDSERFSLQEGWNFNHASHRRAFIQKVKDEEPDSILLAPMCTLWSMLQELTAAQYEDYKEKLKLDRQENHDTILTFVAVVYEMQRRAGRDATVEHPWMSRAWSTKAFMRMNGFDTYVDQCCYKLRLPDDEGVMRLVKKPTCFKTTGETIYKMLHACCDQGHRHTPLEGSVPGAGPRSKLAENYPPLLASRLAEALVTQVNNWSDVNVADEEREDYNLHVDPPDAVEMSEPVRKNRELRKQVGSRAVDYVQRLHKNLGHVGKETLQRMLQEVQATDNVMIAAREYVCPACYARNRPAQAPPSSGVKTFEFNDRIQVDSHWIRCEDSIVSKKAPAPGTPAAKRQETEITGRQCVLTIVDHATRYCSVRILRAETAEEFTKGVERAWIKRFGIPKYLRIDEAKGWTSKHVREWASSRGVTLEVQPAEQHSWLGVVERKHQVVRRALELYQDDHGRHDLSTLKEAAIYVPHAINQTSMVRGFTPQQWVLGKTMTYAHGLSGEIFNPGQEAIDEAGAFSQVQKKRMAAQIAWIKADSDAKLRRAFNQKFQDVKETLAVGQRCWYWRVAGSGILQKAKWSGPARVVAVEDHEGTRVLWLCHGTSLVRCGERQVKPLVEETGATVEADRQAALRDLEELKARSTTQFKDALRAAYDPNLEDNFDEPDYSPTTVAPADEQQDPMFGEDLFDAEAEAAAEAAALPGILRMIMPRAEEQDRERTPRRNQDPAATRRPSAATTVPIEEDEEERDRSPKRRIDVADDERVTQRRVEVQQETSSASRPDGEHVPLPMDDDELAVDVYIQDVIGELPAGWRCIDGQFELEDDIYHMAHRKGEVNLKKLDLTGQESFVAAKKTELENYFGNLVWEFATGEEGARAERNGRTITARWVLTWKQLDDQDEQPRWKAKARLVLRGFEDPDLLTLQKAAPTASRLARTMLLSMTSWLSWSLTCGDVRAAFLSGKTFTRELIVRLPADCAGLLGVRHPCYMKMLKSAYGLADAPLLWYKEADRRLQKCGWSRHPMDKCCYLLNKKNENAELQCIGILILHVDDILVAGDESQIYKKAVQQLRANFDFGKWDVLTKKTPIKYCGGVIVMRDDGKIEVSYEEYIKKICPMTIAKGRDVKAAVNEQERSKARGLVGALQWPATQGFPGLAASVSIQAGELAGGDGSVLQELNKTLRFAKQNASHRLKFLAEDETQNIRNMTLILFADAAFDVRKDHSSQGGFVIMAVPKEALEGKKVPASTVSWRSFKLPRVCRSSLGAECQALSTALEELMMVKSFLMKIQFPELELKEIQEKLNVVKSAVITDCKALYDGMKRESIQQAADKRVAIESLVIRDLLRDLNCQWRWVSSERQLADGLTKTNARQAYIERHRGGYVQLVADENCTAAKKKTKEERKKTIQETQGTTSNVARSLIGLVMTESVTSTRATSEEGEINPTEIIKENATNYSKELMVNEGFTWSECMVIVMVITIGGVMIFLIVKWIVNKIENYMDRWYVPRKEWMHIQDECDRLNYENGELAEAKKKYEDGLKEFQTFMDSKGEDEGNLMKRFEALIDEKCQLQEKVEDLQGELGTMEARIFDKDEEIAWRAQSMTNLQMATATYQRQVNDLRREIFRVERQRFTIHVARNGRCWHSSTDCHCIRQSSGVRSLEACTHCTG